MQMRASIIVMIVFLLDKIIILNSYSRSDTS
jgi:hypothetical protein